ncbi:glycosyltransferase family 1 protein [Exiguobacterium aestuarii]|uniref:glycosyltransferase family 1 protein n=1 Tax=Exiguobacterium aestuarii TaxID=273527 RepID=UPI001CD3B20A|nr:glycosyltransferase family 1 protein [Exiguobacterium aestuarii]MCA0981207.1 glycosyltransferase family 1 protein [Exiguobacterium aestuarii]
MDLPIRVLQVFAQMNRGGAETMIMNIYRNIDRSKVQFDFVVHTELECDFDDEIQRLGGKIYKVPLYNGKNHFQYSQAWKLFFEDHPEYRIIHGHVRSTASVYLSIAKRYKLVTIAHSHNTSSGTGFSAFAKNVLQYPIRYIADHLFACSNSAGQWLYGFNSMRKKNFHIINNSIATQDFIFNYQSRERIRKEFQVENKFVIGHVGRFHKQKNHDFLIDVFKSIHEKNGNSILMLVGDGPLRKSIEEKVKNVGLTNQVIFTGVRSDIPELLQAMDVFAFPSLYEGLGIVAVEAQAAGLPCIVSDKLPNEVLVTNLIKKEKINKTKYWVNSILEFNETKERTDTSDQIKSNGYDIEESTEWLERFYLKNV